MTFDNRLNFATFLLSVTSLLILLDTDQTGKFRFLKLQRDLHCNERLSQHLVLAPLNEKFIISSELPEFGRLSNMKMSIAEVIGLALVLNRSALLPRFDSCMYHPNTVKHKEDTHFTILNDDSSFEQLFDSSSFSHVSVMSYSGINLRRICGNDIISVSMAKVRDNAKNSISDEIPVFLSDIHLKEPFLFGNDISLESSLKSYPYDKYFLPIVSEQWAKDLISDTLLPDKLASFNNHKCIVMGKNYLSLNWARLPSVFDEVHKELIPSPVIRTDVLDFLNRNHLLGEYDQSHCSFSIVPFLGIHLRMGDFLKYEYFHSFGRDCNENPEVIVMQIKKSLEWFMRWSSERNGTFPPIVLATDDYDSKCVSRIHDEFPVIILHGVSRFHSNSCRGALFDQEVLGVSSVFLGDKLSTFSQSIHQIRTIRNLHSVDTTIWL